MKMKYFYFAGLLLSLLQAIDAKSQQTTSQNNIPPTSAVDPGWYNQAKSVIESKQHAFKAGANHSYAALNAKSNSLFQVYPDGYLFKQGSNNDDHGIRFTVSMINQHAWKPVNTVSKMKDDGKSVDYH